MRPKHLIITAALLIPCAMMAQDRTGVVPRGEAGQRDARPEARPTAERRDAGTDPRAAAEKRVQQYQNALRLTEAQKNEMMGKLFRAEHEIMPMREQCAAIQQSMQATMDRSIIEAESILDERQQKILAEMRSEGKFVSEPVSCGSKTEGGACCAAKADAQKPQRGERVEPAPRPETPVRPSKPAER